MPPQRPGHLISVIIPSYNCREYIGEAIDSVLSQDYPNIELVVIDDGSSDGTVDALANIVDKISYIRQANKGIGGARNTGLRHASGNFIAYLDADDIFTPGRLGLQMSCLEADPALDCVQGHIIQFISPELGPEFARGLRVDTSRLLPAPMASTTLIRREALERVGPWSTELTVGTDLEWYARVQDAGLRCLMLDQAVLKRRIHRTNTNLVHADRNNERLHVLKAMLDRRRKQQANAN